MCLKNYHAVVTLQIVQPITYSHLAIKEVFESTQVIISHKSYQIIIDIWRKCLTISMKLSFFPSSRTHYLILRFPMVAVHFQLHISVNKLHDSFQRSYKEHHSTQAALVHVIMVILGLLTINQLYYWFSLI